MLRPLFASFCALLLWAPLACHEPEAASDLTPTAVPTDAARVPAHDADPTRAGSTTSPGSTALDPAAHDWLWSSPEDPAAVELSGATDELAGQQYLTGNEHHLEAFAERLGSAHGGGYLGVGADQSYSMIAWADPELAWLIDYDADVVAIHRVHLCFLRAAQGPDEFFELWSREGKQRARELLRDDAHASLGDAGERERLIELQQSNLRIIHNRLEELRLSPALTGIPNYLTDEALFQRVRALALADRIRPLVVDLRGEVGMLGIAEAARALDVPLRVIYLSNAEEYWDDYGDAYRRNIAALPWRQDAVVLRTLLTWSRNQDYAYNLQGMGNYLAWLDRPWVKLVYQVVHRPIKPELGPDELDVFETTRDPSESPADLRWRRRNPGASELASQAPLAPEAGERVSDQPY